MIQDILTTFLNNVAVTATADSDTLDLGAAARDISPDTDLYLVIKVDTTFTAAGAATMQIDFKTDDDVAFGSPNIIPLLPATGKATFVAGYTLKIPLPGPTERYNKITLTIATGPMTAGKLSAFLVQGLQAWKAYAAPNQA